MPEAIASLIQWDGPPRERQVILGAAEGKTDRQIAFELGISPETVATYWRRIRLRHGGTSRTEIIASLCLNTAAVGDLEAKEMEARMLRGLIDQMEPLFAENDRREVLAANRSLLNWLGLDASCSWVGRDGGEIVHRLTEVTNGALGNALTNWPSQMGQEGSFPLPRESGAVSARRQLIRWPGGDVSQMWRFSLAAPASSAIVMMAEGKAAAA